MSRDDPRARARRNGTGNINLATIVRKLGLYNKLFKGAAGDHEYPKRENKEQQEEIFRLEISLMEKNAEVEKLKELCLKHREEIKSLESTILFPDSTMSSQHISSLQRQLASRLKVSLMEKNTEVEKLKDLCLKQREEIKSLHSTILFPDSSMSLQLISSLQRQLASLEGRLQSLAHDVAEVKAEKYSGRGIFDHPFSFPMTSLYDRGDGAKPRFDQVYTSAHYAVSDQDEKGAN